MAIWDTAYHAAMPVEDDTSEVGRLIEAVYDFATVPFYGVFQADVILREYEAVCRCLRGAGVTCPIVDEFVTL